jgi:hypothetical protein
MKLEIHRQNFGKDSDGQWHQKVDGEWLPIPAPDWYKKVKATKTKEEKIIDLDSMRMKPPSKKHKIKMVKVYRVTEKTVPDFEAEVLKRNGWTDYYPGSLRHYQEDDTAELS